MDTLLREAIADIHEFYGDAMCLDFANTLEPRGGPPPIAVPDGVPIDDDLTTYGHLVAWTHLAGGYDRETALALLDQAARDPAAADRVLAAAHSFRDVLYRIFWSVAGHREPAVADLAALRDIYVAAIAGAELVPGQEWAWRDAGPDLARPLYPVARSAMEMLTHGRLDRIKVCPGAGRPPVHCAWLFLDTTKNGSRRWCSMGDCGAAEKARQQTARRRARRASSV
jgi:predicted RNA-binding Zn ribbon-like protein